VASWIFSRALPAAALHPGDHLLAARFHGAHCFFDLRSHGGDEVAYLFSRAHGAFRQFAHFVGDHREPTPMLAGPRRLYRGIESQQVRLLGDLIDGLHYHADLPAERRQTEP
jgi:hypothetical protein